MQILEEIIKQKVREVDFRKSLKSITELEKSIWYLRKPFSLKSGISKNLKTSVIAEFKIKSPLKGVINDNVSVEEVTQKYIKAGAVGLSVLTDTLFFGGTNNDLIAARYLHECPILRKDFIIDEYQVIESKAIGADIILLIAAILSKNQVIELSGIAKTLGLEVLLEVHQKEELDKMNENIDIIGVNNRNLMTFAVDIQTSLDVKKFIPPEFIKISESGIHSKEQVRKLKEAGYNGFLIGENFMKESDPGEACKKFIDSLN